MGDNPCQETDDCGDVVPNYRRLSRDGNSPIYFRSSIPPGSSPPTTLLGRSLKARPFSKAWGPMGEAVRRAISPAMGWG